MGLYQSIRSAIPLFHPDIDPYLSCRSRSLYQFQSGMQALSFLLIIAIGLMTFGFTLLKLALPDSIVNAHFFFFLLQVLRWLIIVSVLLLAISFIYYLAPSRNERFRFISAGSTLSTLLILLTTLGFNFYVDNFSRYNALYGSIGTLMVILLWIYANSYVLLIGFELNASIRVAGHDVPSNP